MRLILVNYGNSELNCNFFLKCMLHSTCENTTVFFSANFNSVEDVITGKRIYITASTAKEHTHKLWLNEGKRFF